jgi:hypothetical protein
VEAGSVAIASGFAPPRSMTAPILFCHYGNTEYLRYTLRCARLANPAARVILLGDDTNRRVAARSGIEHRAFSDFDHGPELETFDRVYQLITGAKHANVKSSNSRDWVNFVFRRWFFVHNFLRREGLGAFWHFDTDTMILDTLANHEHKFAAYACTEQCNGSCMNGYVSGPDVVQAYLRTINDLFQREELLQAQQREFDEQHPGYAFTEMRAYEFFRQEEQVRTIRLATVIDDSAFDDAVCQDQGLESELLPWGVQGKKVYLAPGGRFFCRSRTDGTWIRMNSLNLSWVPLSLFPTVLHHFETRHQGPALPPDAARTRTLATSTAPLAFTVERAARRLGRLLRRPFASRPSGA